jgi:hypothetical protein
MRIANAPFCSYRGEVEQLFVPQYLRRRLFLPFLPVGAVHAAELAAIRNGHPQVINLP